MARLAGLWVAAALGAALCAATKLEDVEESATTTTDINPIAKLPVEIPQEFLEKVRYELEPATSHRFPYTSVLPVPWATEILSALDNQTPDERDNIIPWQDTSIGESDTVADTDSNNKVNLVKTASRMLVAEAERRKRFKKKMLELMRFSPVDQKSKEDLVKTKNTSKVKEFFDRGAEDMMDETVGVFRHIAQIMPLVHMLLAPRQSELFRPFQWPSPIETTVSHSQETKKGEDELLMKGFSFDEKLLSDGYVSSESSRNPPSDSSFRIDIAVIPVRSRLLPQRSQQLLLTDTSYTHTATDPPATQGTNSNAVFPQSLLLIPKLLEVVQNKGIIVDGVEKPPINEEIFSTAERNISPPETSSILLAALSPQSSPERTFSPGNSIAPRDSKTRASQESAAPESSTQLSRKTISTSKILPQETIVTRRKRETDVVSTDAETTTEIPTSTKADDQNPDISRRMLIGDQVMSSVIGPQKPCCVAMATGNLPISTPEPFNPFLLPNFGTSYRIPKFAGLGMDSALLLNNMRPHIMKPFINKPMVPLFWGGSPLLYEKLAHQMKMFPKFPTAAMMSPQQLAAEMLTMNSMLTSTESALAAPAATPAGLLSNALPCCPVAPAAGPCMRSCPSGAWRSLSREKRNVGSGSERNAQTQLGLDYASMSKLQEEYTKATANRGISEINDESEGKESKQTVHPTPNELFWKNLLTAFYLRQFPMATPVHVTFFSKYTNGVKEMLQGTGTNNALFKKSYVHSDLPVEAMTSGNGRKDGISNGEIPKQLSRVNTEDKPFMSKDLLIRKWKKVPATTSPSLVESRANAGAHAPSASGAGGAASAGQWAGPPRAFGIVPFESRQPKSLLGDGEAFPQDESERLSLRGRRSVDSAAGDERAAGAAAGEAVRAIEGLRSHAPTQGPSHSRHRSKFSSRQNQLPPPVQMEDAEDAYERHRFLSVRPELPFLDPIMIDDDHIHFHSRDMGNDFIPLP